MDRRLIILRHGETHWNRSGRYQGQQDAPLTLTGIAQLRAVAEGLAEAVADLAAFDIWSSPLGRARQSVAILCEVLGRPFDSVKFDDRLMESHYGLWEGLTADEIRRRFPADMAARERDPWTCAPTGGESLGQLGERVLAWWADRAADGPVVVLAHGGSGRTLRGLCQGLGVEAIVAYDDPQTTAVMIDNGQETVLPTPPHLLRRFGLDGAGLRISL